MKEVKEAFLDVTIETQSDEERRRARGLRRFARAVESLTKGLTFVEFLAKTEAKAKTKDGIRSAAFVESLRHLRKSLKELRELRAVLDAEIQWPRSCNEQ